MEAIIKYTDLEISTIIIKPYQQNFLTEFGNIIYVFGPLSQWVRLSYLYSKLQKYIIKVPNGLQTNLVVFY